jgi:hypothetical protein
MSQSFSSSAIAAWTKGISYSYGIYSENGSSLSLVTSDSIGITVTGNSNVSIKATYSDRIGSGSFSSATSLHSFLNAAKIVSLPLSVSMSAGLYFWAQNMSTSSAGANVGYTHAQLFNSELSVTALGGWGGGTVVGSTASLIQEPYGFIYSATTAGLPNSVAYSQMSAYSNLQPYLYFEA